MSFNLKGLQIKLRSFMEFGNVVDEGLDTFLHEMGRFPLRTRPILLFSGHLFRQRERAFDREAARDGGRSRVGLAAAH